MQGIPAVEAMDMLIQRLKKTKTNAEFLLSLSR
jgi:transcription termination factor Rho